VNDLKRFAAPSILSIGVIFLLIGLVQQGFALNFQSGLFNLGVIFTLSGLVAAALGRK